MKNIYLALISFFLTGVLSAANTIIPDSTNIDPSFALTPVTSRTTVLGQDTPDIAIAGVAGYANRTISTNLNPCPSNSTPKVYLTMVRPSCCTAAANSITSYSIRIASVGTNGLTLVNNKYVINISEFYYKYINTTDSAGYDVNFYHGNYTGGVGYWIIYCVVP